MMQAYQGVLWCCLPVVEFCFAEPICWTWGLRTAVPARGDGVDNLWGSEAEWPTAAGACGCCAAPEAKA